MAETTSELERIYTIPLRHAKYGTRAKRADRAVRDVRDYLVRHMKSEQVWISNEVNQTLWRRGKFTIPSRIRVRATRFSDGVIEVSLPESEQMGSQRDAIHERQEKAAETPVLVPAEAEEEEAEEEETKADEAEEEEAEEEETKADEAEEPEADDEAEDTEAGTDEAAEGPKAEAGEETTADEGEETANKTAAGPAEETPPKGSEEE